MKSTTVRDRIYLAGVLARILNVPDDNPVVQGVRKAPRGRPRKSVSRWWPGENLAAYIDWAAKEIEYLADLDQQDQEAWQQCYRKSAWVFRLLVGGAHVLDPWECPTVLDSAEATALVLRVRTFARDAFMWQGCREQAVGLGVRALSLRAELSELARIPEVPPLSALETDILRFLRERPMTGRELADALERKVGTDSHSEDSIRKACRGEALKARRVRNYRGRGGYCIRGHEYLDDSRC